MSINCGAGLCKRAASFFYRIKEIFCFIANIHLIWIKEAPGRAAKSNKQWEKFACKLICENNNKDCENLSYHL